MAEGDGDAVTAASRVEDVAKANVGDAVDNGAQVEDGRGHFLKFGDDAAIELSADP